MPEATLEMTPSHVPPEIQAAQRIDGPNSGEDFNSEAAENT
jgi:hypothetical protein